MRVLGRFPLYGRALGRIDGEVVAVARIRRLRPAAGAGRRHGRAPRWRAGEPASRNRARAAAMTGRIDLRRHVREGDRRRTNRLCTSLEAANIAVGRAAAEGYAGMGGRALDQRRRLAAVASRWRRRTCLQAVEAAKRPVAGLKGLRHDDAPRLGAHPRGGRRAATPGQGRARRVRRRACAWDGATVVSNGTRRPRPARRRVAHGFASRRVPGAELQAAPRAVVLELRVHERRLGGGRRVCHGAPATTAQDHSVWRFSISRYNTCKASS